MNLNIDMSEIIEFVMPIKSEYSEQNDGGGCDDDDADADGNHYVVLDSVDVGRDFKNEEFLLVNDDGTGGQLLLDNAHLHQQLVNCADLLREPRDGQFDDVQYMGEEQLPEDVDDLVEEEEEEDDGQLPVEEQYEQYEQYEDDVHIQDQQSFGWNYVQSTSPLSESVAIKLESMTTTTTNTTTTKSTTTTTTALSPAPSRNKSKSSPHSSARSHVDHVAIDASFEEIAHVADVQEVEEPAPLAKPSEKMLDQFKGPRRYMLFDELIATIVDFDEDGTPIVEFSMIGSVHDEKLPVECGICPDVMHKSKLSKHQKTHMVPGTNRYACIYCTETYRDCKYLAGHARRHMGIRPYVCEPCKLYFSTKQDLHVHNQRRHLKKEHICEMCGKTFAQNTQLKRHREATHEKKRRFQCEHCQKAYYKNFSLQEHIRNVHMGKRRMLKCPFCGMQCRDAHKMARHRKEMHLNQDTYVCHLCQEEFTDINYFDAHKRSIQCRSNTRRLVNQAQGRTSNEDGDTMDECNELAGMLEEEYDEDAGLLVESTEASGVDGVDGIIGGAVADEDQPRDDETIYETVNGNFLHGEVEDQQPYAQQYDPSSYDDDGLLVEQVADDEEDHSEEILNDDEEYLDPALDHQTQQQHQQQAGHEYNEDELIYEITLETEDN
ncbi:PREDICTED: zinc finger protein 182 [Drosophila arizonae]|uniref:Zinc finger protein 182 n=1 Tax=Drosophila arizonae TaxID=7263 RepID=A0ABM1PQ83_DROAR|nr:PREDICTED: zinc finger protein 182 [Drosophila arizonae]